MTTAVAIALYNGERFLYKQLESIRTQAKTPDQVVFCDDGSTDNTVAMVNDYIQKHGLADKWTLVINEKNLGYARNFFKAMSLCQADLIFLGDQDDIWKSDKIEKMTAVMEQNSHIDLLCSKFEIMDGEDRVMHGVLARKQKETFALRSVNNRDLLRGFYWLGMLMCVRRDYLQTLLPVAKDLTIAHDRVLSHCAADQGRFYEYDYVGAFHRRHENNTAREEHRVSKLLDLPKKLMEIGVSRKLWEDMLDSDLPLSQKSRQQIVQRLALLEKRDVALRNKSLAKVLRLYADDGGQYLRKASLLCDIWLSIFGKQERKSL
jgi:glycosyltransferase involved in cell wall biosynthesis